jgi:hypothetical protein
MFVCDLLCAVGGPTDRALKLELVDTDTSIGHVYGNLKIYFALTTAATQFELYWYDSRENIGIIQTIDVGATSPMAILINTTLPIEATEIACYSTNIYGTFVRSTLLRIVDLGRTAPIVPASFVDFQDTSAEGGVISGAIRIGRAANETGITAYTVYWGKGEGIVIDGLDYVAMVSALMPSGKSDSDAFVSITLDSVTVPSQASYLIVKTENVGATMARGVSVPVNDLQSPYVILSPTDVSVGVKAPATMTCKVISLEFVNFFVYLLVFIYSFCLTRLKIFPKKKKKSKCTL